MRDETSPASGQVPIDLRSGLRSQVDAAFATDAAERGGDDGLGEPAKSSTDPGMRRFAISVLSSSTRQCRSDPARFRDLKHAPTTRRRSKNSEILALLPYCDFVSGRLLVYAPCLEPRRLTLLELG